MKKFLKDFAPPGLDAAREIRMIGAGMGVSFLFGLVFLFRYLAARKSLYYTVQGESLLRQGALMEGFGELFGGAHMGFRIIALGMLFLGFYHYLYFYRGSKSIYTMARIPNPWELHVRCLGIPLVTVLCCGICILLLVLSSYGIYITFTPEECLPAGSLEDLWQKIWRFI